jgi:DNA-binding SARP family transcriptional activator
MLLLDIDNDAGTHDEVLVDRLWPHGQPPNAAFSLRNQIAKLRKLLGSDVIVRTAAGYRIDLESSTLDIGEFDEAIADARTWFRDGAVDRAAESVVAALAMVRGPAFEHVRDEPWARAVLVDIDERIMLAEELWATVQLRRGHVGRELPRLRENAEAQPQREIRWQQLVEAATHSGRRVEAVRAAGDARAALAEFGMLPGTALVWAERAALRSGDRDRRPRSGAQRLSSARDGPIVGRDASLDDLTSAGIGWVEGERGCGKTRLLAELADRARSDGELVLYVQVERAGSTGGHVLADLAREIFLGAELATVPHDLWRLFAPRAVIEEPSPSGELRLTRIRTALCALLANAATAVDPRRLRVIVDDADRLDQMSSDVLAQVIEHAPPGVRFVIAATPGIADGSLRDSVVARRDAVRTTVGPLDARALHELVEALSADLDVAGRAALTRDVVLLTNGEPQFAVELIRHRSRSLVTGIESEPAGLGVTGAVARAGLPAAPADLVRRRPVAPLDAGGAEAMLVADQLLELELRSAGDTELLDVVVAGLLTEMTTNVSAAEACTLARRYMSAVGTGDLRTESVRAHLLAGTALLAGGERDDGRALLDLVIDRARRSGHLELHVDAVLARGPIETGSPNSRRIADEAEELLARLDRDDVPRWVQLSCWAAHHRLNHGEHRRGMELLDRALPVASSSVAPVWRSLVLGVRAQGEQSAAGDPRRAHIAADELRNWSRLTGDDSGEAAACLIRAGIAFISGTLDDVAVARDEIADVARRVPRPDLAWFPLAMDAASLLAGGQRDRAAAAIATAEEVGRDTGVHAAGSTAMLHHAQLMLLDGTFAAMATVLDPGSDIAAARPEGLALYGLACVRAGDRSGTDRAAAALLPHERMLAAAGLGWPLVAMAGAEVAWFARNAQLAQALWDELHHWSGSGLTTFGVSYLGAADTALGLLAATLDRVDAATDLLAAAIAQEHHRGATVCEARARQLLASLITVS